MGTVDSVVPDTPILPCWLRPRRINMVAACATWSSLWDLPPVLDEHQTVSRPSDKVGPLQAVAVGPDETVVRRIFVTNVGIPRH